MASPSVGFLQRLPSVSLFDPLLTLLIANAATIILAMVEGWNLATVLLIYWFQSVTIGIFTVAQLRTLLLTGPVLGREKLVGLKIGSRKSPKSTLRRFDSASFFAVHYGFFHFLYLLFILTLWNESGQGLQGFPEILLSCALFFVAHLYSFLFYRTREKPGRISESEVFFRPYARIIPMHLTILAGGIIIDLAPGLGLDTNRMAVLFFLSLKTVIDILSHWWKHAYLRRESAVSDGY